MAGISLLEASLLFGGVVLAAVFGGILAGLLGVGGGIVFVPTLFWVFLAIGLDNSISMHVAVATSLATIVATSISSARAHHKRGAIDLALMRAWGPWLAVGALVGGGVASALNTKVLLLVFGAVGLLVAFNFVRPHSLVLAQQPPRRALTQAPIAFSIGGISAVMGIGGGTLSVPVLSACSVPIHRAVGTAASFGVIIAVPAVIALVIGGWGINGRPPGSLGYVNVIAAILILTISTRMAPVGAYLAHALDARWIKRAFALFLALTSARMLWTALG